MLYFLGRSETHIFTLLTIFVQPIHHLMKLIRYIVAAVALCATYACTKFDDSALWQAINKNAADIAALKEKTNNLNSDIIALQQLVAALQNRDYITNCTPLADGTGYTVAFNSGKSILARFRQPRL